MQLQDLKKEIPYQWRVQSFSKNKPSAQCVAYIDARDVQKILDEVVGAENWQDDYKEASGLLFAGIGIKVKDEWIWKWDTGSESDIEKEKGHVSDSFKRAAVKWGVGRFLYDLPIKFVKASAIKTPTTYPHVIDDNGKQVWDLTEYINNLSFATANPIVRPASTAKSPTTPQAQAMAQAKQTAIKQDDLTALKTKLTRLGAKNEDEALKILEEKTGVPVAKIADIDSDMAKELLAMFN